MVKIIFISALVTVSVLLTGCGTGGKASMKPGTHSLTSEDAGTWRAPGSKSCQWAYTYRTTTKLSSPKKTIRGGGFSPSVKISGLGTRFTSDNCGVFTR